MQLPQAKKQAQQRRRKCQYRRVRGSHRCQEMHQLCSKTRCHQHTVALLVGPVTVAVRAALRALQHASAHSQLVDVPPASCSNRSCQGRLSACQTEPLLHLDRGPVLFFEPVRLYQTKDNGGLCTSTPCGPVLGLTVGEIRDPKP